MIFFFLRSFDSLKHRKDKELAQDHLAKRGTEWELLSHSLLPHPLLHSVNWLPKGAFGPFLFVISLLPCILPYPWDFVASSTHSREEGDLVLSHNSLAVWLHDYGKFLLFLAPIFLQKQSRNVCMCVEGCPWAWSRVTMWVTHVGALID